MRDAGRAQRRRASETVRPPSHENPRVSVRLARVTDRNAIATVNYLAAVQEHADIQPVHPCGIVPSESGSDRYWRINLAGLLDAACVAVATVEDDRVVGYALGRHEPLETAAGMFQGELQMLGVLPDQQQHGVGRALVTLVGDELRDHRGITSMYAWVWDGNERARTFYARIGGREVAARDERCDDGMRYSQHAFGWTTELR